MLDMFILQKRAEVTEGQNSKWPDECVTLGKFHPPVSRGSNSQLVVSF